MKEPSSVTAALDEVRHNIDLVDRKIVDLLAERQHWVEAAGKLKKDDAAVRAPARVEQVISKVRALAKESGASQDVVESTYRALIAAFVELELAHHRSK